MKTFLLVVAALFVVSASFGAEQFSAALTSTDAGTSNTVAVKRMQEYTLQCSNPACFKTGTTTPLAADCSQDYVIDGRISGNSTPDAGAVGYSTMTVPSKHQHSFNAGSAQYVAARALDGGSPACNLFLDQH